MRTSTSLGLLTVLLLLPRAALAAEPSHEGFLLRASLGVGGGSASTDGTPELELGGGAGFFSIDIGGSLTRGLALHARLAAHSLVEPSVSIGGDEVGELDDSALSFRTLGLGLTYYFPSNLYLTGVIGASTATLEVNADEYESDTGFGLMGDIGYEWAVGGDWGIGLAGRIERHSVPDEEGGRITGVALGVLFSATYN